MEPTKPLSDIILTDPERQETDTNLLTLTFRIGTQQYGLPVAIVIEIVRLPALITLAGAPPTIIGLLNLRGQYIPVLDGSLLIGETPVYDLNNQIIIAGRREHHTLIPVLGLRVDQVFDVQTLNLKGLTRLHKTIAASFLQGVIKAQDESVLLFDMAALSELVPDSESLEPDELAPVGTP